MKEFNIPAFIPPSEIDRTAFIKDFEKTDWRYVESLLPHLEKLEDLGLVAQTVAIRETGSKVYILMERVNGFELGSIPEEYEDYRFSVDLAKKAASLFHRFFEAGYYHDDPHSQNIMYDQVKSRCIAVDLDSIIVKDDDISLKDYVEDYSELMLDVYLGNNPLETLDELFSKGELQQYMPEDWEEFNRKAEGYKRQYPSGEIYDAGICDLFRVYSYQLVSKLMQEKGIYSKLYPVVREFVLRGLNPSTAPENFDDILRFDFQKRDTIMV